MRTSALFLLACLLLAAWPAQAQRADSSRNGAMRTDTARTDFARTDTARTDFARTDTARTDTARVDSAKAESIRKMMRLTGAKKVGQQMIARTLGIMQRRHPEVPDAWWERFVSKIDMEELMERIVPLYAKHFTHGEIKRLIAFYETPLGQKVVQEMPALMQESMTAGQAWGRELARGVRRELEKEGYVETAGTGAGNAGKGKAGT